MKHPFTTAHPRPVLPKLSSRTRTDWVDEWRRQTACRGVDTELLFAEDGGCDAEHTALRMCLGCPVRNECLAYALDYCTGTASSQRLDLNGVGGRWPGYLMSAAGTRCRRVIAMRDDTPQPVAVGRSSGCVTVPLSRVGVDLHP